MRLAFSPAVPYNREYNDNLNEAQQGTFAYRRQVSKVTIATALQEAVNKLIRLVA